MIQFFLVTFVSLFSILTSLSCYLLIQLTLIFNNHYTGFFFFLIPINALIGGLVSQTILNFFNVLPDSQIKNVFIKDTSNNQIQLNKDDKLKYFGIYSAFFLSFFLSVPIYLAMASYNQSYQLETYGTNGILIVQSKNTYVSHGTKYKIQGQLKYSEKTVEDVSMDITKERYDELKNGEEIKVFFSKEDLSIIRESK